MFHKHLLALLASMCISSPLFANGELLSQEQLDKVFRGKTAFGYHIKKKLEIKDYYAKKGKFISLRSNGKRLKGKWWVSKKRNAICIKYKHKKNKFYCRAVTDNGDGSYSRIRRKDSKELIRYDKLLKGNKTRKSKKKRK